MIQIAIKIGDAISLNDPENETITPDDRQERLEIIGGVVVQDYGHIEDGDTITWTLQFFSDQWEIVKNHWNNRDIVTIEDAAGETFDARVVVRSYKRIYRFESKAIEANIELWRV